MIVLAIAIPVGLDSMGKVFAGARFGATNPNQSANEGIYSGGNGNAGLLNAARRFFVHKQNPPTDNFLAGDSNGKRFDRADNGGNGHSYAPWLDGNYPLQLWHSNEFNSLGNADGPSNNGNSGNGGNGGNGGAPGNPGTGFGFGGGIGGGTILPGGPAGGNGGGAGSGPSNSNSSSSSSSNPVIGTIGTDTGAPAAATPEPGSILLFGTGLALIVAGRRLRRAPESC
ncbi:MAG TPA: PEP-CTERM sorting domain-containing protein [Candidatus Acidoferrales bacterium]|nr:PEP-CTERM sorting domain-containing protein [Candidatus Acidoferrales bacterium]